MVRGVESMGETGEGMFLGLGFPGSGFQKEPTGVSWRRSGGIPRMRGRGREARVGSARRTLARTIRNRKLSLCRRWRIRA